MSAELSSRNNVSKRSLTADEKRLVQALLDEAGGLDLSPDWVDMIEVEPMGDGGMGSLHFLSSPARKMTRQVAELRFRDSDGVSVIASLNVDEAGVPFELDVWKVDFSPLTKIPEQLTGSSSHPDRP